MLRVCSQLSPLALVTHSSHPCPHDCTIVSLCLLEQSQVPTMPWCASSHAPPHTAQGCGTTTELSRKQAQVSFAQCTHAFHKREGARPRMPTHAHTCPHVFACFCCIPEPSLVQICGMHSTRSASLAVAYRRVAQHCSTAASSRTCATAAFRSRASSMRANTHTCILSHTHTHTHILSPFAVVHSPSQTVCFFLFQLRLLALC